MFNGRFEYQPSPGYTGTDSFTYVASDGKGGTDTATVYIEVLPASPPPGEWDFGDAPTQAERQDLAHSYPTLLKDNGARHKIVGGGPWLGFTSPYSLGPPDAEPDGQPHVYALGDDLDSNGDDENAVSGTGWWKVLPHTLDVIVGNPTGGVVQAWIDWNGDGVWADSPPERVFAGYLSQGSHFITVKAPSDAVESPFARFRISSKGGLPPTGPALDGEVEDYELHVWEVDFGDAPDPTYPTLYASGGPLFRVEQGFCLGAACDGEADAKSNVHASGDSSDDGVVFIGPMVSDTTAVVQVTASMQGLLKAWIDFNANGIWEPAEQIVYSGASSIPAGKTSISFDVPPGAKLGPTFARFLFWDGFTAPAAWEQMTPTSGGECSGEVEDYKVWIGPDGPYPPGTGPGTSSITGVKWNDLDGDCIKDPGEPGLPGWEIRLDCQVDGMYCAPALPAGSTSAWTGGNGEYTFPVSLKTCDCGYGLWEVPKAGWVQTFKGDATGNGTHDFGNQQTTDKYDYGDAPLGVTPSGAAYKYGVARHKLGGPYLGSVAPDSEGGMQPSPPGFGDDDTGSPDDEDGVTIPPFEPTDKLVTVTVVASDAGYLNAWLDFNGDGDWLDTGEQICKDKLLNPGPNFCTFTVPAWTKTCYTYARFRISTKKGVGSSGAAPDGEVEDYLVTIGTPGSVLPPGTVVPPGGLIWGCKWDDLNANGTLDPLEKRLPGWTIQVDSNHNGKFDSQDLSTTTDQNGYFLFMGLPPATYTVGEKMQAGWTQTKPGSPTTYTVTIPSNQVFLRRDFGNTQGTVPGLGPDEIGVCKWVDNNGNGGRDVDIPADIGLAGWVFWLDKNNNGVKDPGEPEGKTLSGGYYTFKGLAAGTYVVHEESLPGWKQTVPGGNGTYTVTLPPPAGQPNKVREFANQPPSGPLPGGTLDYGDAPTKAQSGFANSYPDAWHPLGGPYAGSVPPDAESASQNSPLADGDDNTGTADEDGFSPQNYLVVGQTVTIETTFTRLKANVSTSIGLWIDLNRDGVWDNVEERRAAELKSGGLTGLYFFLNAFTVPSNVTPGKTYARIRVVEGPETSLSPSGAGGPGEVEDHVVEIKPAGWVPPGGVLPPGGVVPPGGIIIYADKWRNLKWSQPPIEIDPKVGQTPVFCGWDEPAFSVQTSAQQRRWVMVADDFHCLGPIPVTSVRWWGSFAGWTDSTLPLVAPTAFHIGIWTGVPADTAYPWGRPEKLVWETTADEWTWEFAGYEQSAAGPGTSVPAAGLVAHWKLDGDATDSAGTSHGTVRGNPVWATGKVDRALRLDGLDDYVELPIGSRISQLTSSTFALWVNWSTAGGAWQRVFDFGKGTNAYMFLSPRVDTSGPMRFAITTGGSSSEQQVTAPTALAGGWHHVAVVIDAAARSMRLYLDGAVVATNTAMTLTPSALGQTTRNWLGKSQYEGDGYYQGFIDDVLIYNRALSANEIKSLVAPPQQQMEEACFEFNHDLPTADWFHQERFQTQQEVFWISITAMYPGSSEGTNHWGWMSRPAGWNNGAVCFERTGAQLQPGLVLAPQGMAFVQDDVACGSVQDYDMAFELRTDPPWVKSDQPFTGLGEWPYYDDRASYATEATNGVVTIVQQVADDWPGVYPQDPVIAMAWEGSYLGYGYEACQCGPTVEPRRPDYFQLLIRTNLPPGAGNPLDRPGDVVWAYEVFDYDEVLVGYDRHPSGEPNEPVFRYSARLPRDKWFWHEGEQAYWLSIMAVYVARADQIKYPWGWTDHKHQFGSAASKLSIGSQGSVRELLSDPTGGLIDMSFTLYTTSESRPIAYWRFDETQGTIAVDSVGGHNGTIHGATWTTGAADGALRFDGGDYVEVSDEADFDITEAITVAAWVSLEAVPADWIGIVTKGDSTWRLSTLLSERRFHFAVNDPQGAFHAVDGTTGVELNEWHHVVGTYDGSSIRLYVDGVEDPAYPVAYTGPIHVDDFLVWIGANAERPGRGFVGRIDEVRVYDVALSQAEVLDLMALADNTAPGRSMPGR